MTDSRDESGSHHDVRTVALDGIITTSVSPFGPSSVYIVNKFVLI
jgi:hypothetical protein